MFIDLSIVVICRENPKELLRTINSILSQTKKSLEIIIVDGSLKELRKDYYFLSEAINILEKKFFKVNYILQNGKGISNAFNLAIKKSTRKYIMFLNSGDELFSSSSLKNIESLIKNDFQLFVSACLISNINQTALKLTKPEKNIKTIYFKNPFAHPSCIFNKKFLIKAGCFNEFLDQCMDYELFIRLILKYNVKIVNSELITSIFYAGGKSSDFETLKLGMKKSWEIHKKQKYYPNFVIRSIFYIRVFLYYLFMKL